MGNPAWAKPEILIEYYERALGALFVVRGTPVQSPLFTQTPFAGLTPDEFELALTETRSELDLEVSMALCASFEATIRTDYRDRVKRKSKSPAGRSLRDLNKLKKEKASLADILDCWGDLDGSSKKAIGELKQVMGYRDWLAHGRYWDQASGLIAPEVELIHERGMAVISFINQHPS